LGLGETRIALDKRKPTGRKSPILTGKGERL
jgi:hypothetical protein